MLELETDERKFRVLYISAVTLCRMVGHVLDKIDKHANIKLSSRISQNWKSISKNKKRNRIFHEFIEVERNIALKEYEFSYNPSDVPLVVGNESHILNDLLYCPIIDGAYEGKDCRDVLETAIHWWEIQLAWIEKRS